MDRFNRTLEPCYLKDARDELCQQKYEASKVWEKFRRRDAYRKLIEELLSISDRTCAFCAGGFYRRLHLDF